MKLSRKYHRAVSTLFQKRNIIIMSERATSHVSMSGKIQFSIFLGILGVISAVSFTTGNYVAAKRVIDEQGQTIKSVANSRIEAGFVYGVPSLTSDAKVEKSDSESVTDPSYNFTTIDESHLVNRISYLEDRIRELKQANQEIVDVVRITADGQISGLEELIENTGLSPELLKRQAEQEKKIRRTKPSASNEDAAQNGVSGGTGGPYIPDTWNDDMKDFAEDLDKSVDKIYVLRKIMEILPTDKPIDGAVHQSSFGRRVDPFTKRIAFHAGLDMTSRSKPEIMAASAGKVIRAGWSGGYGNMVEIDHGLGITTRYGHMRKINVSKGDVVAKGDVVGLQGSTGRSTGAHLHYEIRFNNRPLNPAPFLKVGKKYVSQN